MSATHRSSRTLLTSITFTMALVLLAGCGESATEPEPAPEVAPGARTLDILRADGGWVQRKNRHAPYAEVGVDFDVRGRSAGGHAGRMHAEAVILAGISENPIATSAVYSDWDNAAGDYIVSGKVAWLGHIGGLGIAGAGAKSTLTVKILDFKGRVLAQEKLNEFEIREGALTAGASKDEGTQSFAIEFYHPGNAGGPFRIQFELVCEAYSGLLGADVLCLYGNSPELGKAGLDGFAEWTDLAVTWWPNGKQG